MENKVKKTNWFALLHDKAGPIEVICYAYSNALIPSSPAENLVRDFSIMNQSGFGSFKELVYSSIGKPVTVWIFLCAYFTLYWNGKIAKEVHGLGRHGA